MATIKKYAYCILTFILAFLVMTFAFSKVDIFPFGDRQMLNIDSWHQYYPFLQELQRKLTSGESLFYTWNMGLGTNFFLILITYAMSPIYLLSILIPKEYLREFMLFATIFKIALAGGFFSYYLQRTYGRRDIALVSFGLLYAFCGFAMGYYWNIMWLDAYALLPIVLLGLTALVKEGKTLLYTLSLALLIICNFHIGYMICAFILVYTFILYYTHFEGKPFRHLVETAISVASFSFLSCGIAAVVLIPAYKGLALTAAASSNFPTKFSTYFTTLDFFNNALANIPPTVRSGLPNVQTGILALFLIIVYFMMTSIPLKTRILNGGLLLFLFLSFNTNYLNYIWHGFHVPNELPYRFTFIFSFLILKFAYEAFMAIDATDNKQIGRATLIILALIITCEALFSKTFDTKVYYYSFSFLALYSSIIFLNKYKRIKHKSVNFAIFVVVLLEVTVSAINGPATFGTTDRESYIYKNTSVQEILSDLRVQDLDFYRLDFTKWFSSNDPVAYGYRGVSAFSSTVNNNVTKYTKKLGLASWDMGNRYLYASSTPICNGLLGIKYLMSRENEGVVINSSYTLQKQYTDMSLYRTNYTLPIGFMVKPEVKTWSFESNNPFETQSQFIHLATPMKDALFKPIAPTSETIENMQIEKTDDFRHEYNLIQKETGASVKQSFIIPEDGQYYLYQYANYSHEASVTNNGVTQKYETRNGLIINLGTLPKDAPVDISFQLTAGPGGYYDIQLVSFDDALYMPAYETLIDEPLIITKHSATSLEGTIHSQAEGQLYTSIPYEKGWSATVDGVKTPIEPLQNAMVTLPLKAGDHTIKFSYIPDGFIEGISITVGSLILLAVSYILTTRRKK